MLTLNTDIEKINRVGLTTAKRLKKLGITTIQNLLFYWPFRYDDFTKLTPIDQLQPDTKANIVGQIELIQNKRSPRKRMYITEALVSDGTETIKVIWFNQPFIARNLHVGDTVSLAGKIYNDYGGIMMNSPTYEKIYPTPASPAKVGSATPLLDKERELGGEVKPVHTQGLVPNYHLTANITQKQIRFLIKQVIGLARQIPDWLPIEIKKDLQLSDLGGSITKIHFPKNQADIEKAKQRLGFNELFLIQLQSQIIKQELKSAKAQIIKFKEKETKNFVNSLPFKLTNAQRKTSWEILQDISKNRPMTRLLEGDVGSGKTIVAVIAMLNAALNNKQAVLMVPTEILAQQHFDLICKLLNNFNIKIGLLTRSQKKINPATSHQPPATFKQTNNITKKNIIDNINKGKIDIIIGTHALIQEDAQFNNLSLIIIDEQHRFGVKQRKALTVRTEQCPVPTTPHLLSMTATPIPRSLALALYGDLDISIIDEMPKNRKKIITRVVPEKKRKQAYDFILGQIKNNRQIFVICPLIDISDKLGVKSVREEYKKLNEQIFPNLKIDFLHGRMKAKEKQEIMQNFLNNKTKILVSTSVVEVGIDIPNAAIMMIEGADRFGLAQLHQFRGRVGRREYQSYCFLFTDSNNEKTLSRLSALVNNNDGFSLAKMDLKFRGPGEVYGTAQKGFPELKIASLFDYELIKQAKQEAEKIIKIDASLTNWPLLKNKLDEQNKITHLE